MYERFPPELSNEEKRSIEQTWTKFYELLINDKKSIEEIRRGANGGKIIDAYERHIASRCGELGDYRIGINMKTRKLDLRIMNGNPSRMRLEAAFLHASQGNI